MMFTGELGCAVVYGFMRLVWYITGRKPTAVPPGKVVFRFCPHTLYFAIPALCDLLATVLFNMGMYYTQPSVQQMLRNLTTLFIAGFSAVLWRDFRRAFDLPNGIGLLVLTVGACIVTYTSVSFNQPNSGEAHNPVLGAVLVLIGCLFSSMLYITEEIFLRKLHIDSGLIGVAIEGGWGVLILAVLIPVLSFVDDPFSDATPRPKMEDPALWYAQVSGSPALIGTHVGYVMFTLVANYSGMEITKCISSSARATFDAMRTIIVWLVSFAIGWEVWDNVGTPVRFVGFVMVTTGVLLYNNVVKFVPYVKR